VKKAAVSAIELFRRRMKYAESFPYRDVLRRDPCVYCTAWPVPWLQSKQMTIEHIEPRSEGGKDNWRNLAGAHEGCNHHRGSRRLLPYLLYRQRLSLLVGTKNKKLRTRLKREMSSVLIPRSQG
jgi:5-methylcytosine-specific restriction endonuclease McrA